MRAPFNASANRIYVRGVPQSVSREEIVTYFSQFGVVTDAYLPQVPGAATHKGGAFVSVQTPETLQLILRRSPHRLHGSHVTIEVAAPRGSVAGFVEALPAAQVVEANDISRTVPAQGAQHPRTVPARASPYGTAAKAAMAEESTHSFGSVDGDAASPPSLAGSPSFGSPTQDVVALAEAQLSPSATMRSALLGGNATAGFIAPSVAGAVAAPAASGVMGRPGGKGLGSMMRKGAHAFGRTAGTPVPGRIFLTKVAPAITKQDLQAYFQQFGNLTDCYVPANKGIAFVSFEDAVVVERVLANKEHTVKFGQPVVLVEQAIDRSEFSSGGAFRGGPPGSSGQLVPGRIFVTNVPLDVSRHDLQEYFSQFGQLSDCYAPNNGKGIAFVSFVEPEAAQQVLFNKEHFVKSAVIQVEQAVDRAPLGKGSTINASAFSLGASPGQSAAAASSGAWTQRAEPPLTTAPPQGTAAHSAFGVFQNGTVPQGTSASQGNAAHQDGWPEGFPVHQDVPATQGLAAWQGNAAPHGIQAAESLVGNFGATASQGVADPNGVPAHQDHAAPQDIAASDNIATPHTVVAPPAAMAHQAVAAPQGIAAPHGFAMHQGVAGTQGLAAPQSAAVHHSSAALPQCLPPFHSIAAPSNMLAPQSGLGGVQQSFGGFSQQVNTATFGSVGTLSFSPTDYIGVGATSARATPY